MSICIYRAGVAIAAALAFAAFAPCAHAQSAAPVTTTPIPGAAYDGWSVAQFGGRQVWNRRLAHHRFVLMTRVGQMVSRVPVRSQRTPFVVTMGKDQAGRVVAVYARCRRFQDRQPADCRLFRFDFAHAGEAPLTETRAPRASETTAALDDGKLAFARTDRHGHTSILIRRLGARSAARTTYRFRYPVRAHVYVTGMALSRQGLAFSSENDYLQHDYGTTGYVNETLLFFKPAGHRVRQVAQGTLGEENWKVHTSPTLANGTLYWAFSNADADFHPPNGRVLRCDLASSQPSAMLVPGYLDAVAADPTAAQPPLVTSSFSIDSASGRLGTDELATITAPAWGPLPSADRLTNTVHCPPTPHP
jgi:hypothetical protein